MAARARAQGLDRPGAARGAIRGLRFISRSRADAWGDVEGSFEKLARNGFLSRSDFAQCIAVDDLSVRNRLTASTNKRKRQEVGTDLGCTTSVDLRTSDNMLECDLISIALETNVEVTIEKSEEAVHKTGASSANTEITTAGEVTVKLELSSKKLLPENGQALGFLNEEPNLSSIGAEFAGERDASVEERSIFNTTEAELLPENIEASEHSSFENSLIETKSFSGSIQQSCSLASCELTELSRGISDDKLGAKFEETQKKLDKTLEKLLLVLSTLKDGNSVTRATIYTNSSQFLGSPDCLKIRDVADEADSRSHLLEKGNIEETSGTKQTRNTPNYTVQTFEQDFVDYEENAESCIISKNVLEQNDTGAVSEERNEDDEVDNHVTPGALIHTVYAEEGRQSSLSGSTNLMSGSSHLQEVICPFVARSVGKFRSTQMKLKKRTLSIPQRLLRENGSNSNSNNNNNSRRTVLKEYPPVHGSS